MAVYKLVPNYCNHLLHMTQFEAKSKKKRCSLIYLKRMLCTKTNRIRYAIRMGQKYKKKLSRINAKHFYRNRIYSCVLYMLSASPASRLQWWMEFAYLLNYLLQQNSLSMLTIALCGCDFGRIPIIYQLWNYELSNYRALTIKVLNLQRPNYNLINPSRT